MLCCSTNLCHPHKQTEETLANINIQKLRFNTLLLSRHSLWTTWLVGWLAGYLHCCLALWASAPTLTAASRSLLSLSFSVVWSQSARVCVCVCVHVVGGMAVCHCCLTLAFALSRLFVAFCRGLPRFCGLLCVCFFHAFCPRFVGFVDATAACLLPFATDGAAITASATAVAAASACLAADLCLCVLLLYCFAVLLWGIIVVAVHGLLQSVVWRAQRRHWSGVASVILHDSLANGIQACVFPLVNVILVVIGIARRMWARPKATTTKKWWRSCKQTQSSDWQSWNRQQKSV